MIAKFLNISIFIILILSACSNEATQSPTAMVKPQETATIQLIDPTGTHTVVPPSPTDIPIQKKEGCLQGNESRIELNIPVSGYCLLFPSQFRSIGAEVTPNMVTLLGPRITDGSETVQASLTIQTISARDENKDHVVDVFTDRYAGEEIPQYETIIGGQEAVILEKVPTRIPSRIGIVVANEKVYTFTALPVESESPRAVADMEYIWSMVIDTLWFFPPLVSEPDPSTVAVNPDNWATYEIVDVGISLKLPLDWTINQSQGLFGLTPSSSNGMDLITISLVPGVLIGDIETLTDALISSFQRAENNSPYPEPTSDEDNLVTEQFVLGGFNGVAFINQPDICKDIYLPAYGIVHRISIHPDVCSTYSVINDPIILGILDSITFFEGIYPVNTPYP